MAGPQGNPSVYIHKQITESFDQSHLKHITARAFSLMK